MAAGIEERANRRYNITSQIPLHAVLHLCTNGSCLGAVVAYYELGDQGFSYCFHQPQWQAHRVSDAVPDRPRQILQSANDARHTPIACVAAAVRAVEAMMAEKGYRERRVGLKLRIKKAVTDGILPQQMADLADEVREIGNETHTDEDPMPLTSEADAVQALEFANLLANYLFVLPKRIADAKKRRQLMA